MKIPDALEVTWEANDLAPALRISVADTMALGRDGRWIGPVVDLRLAELLGATIRETPGGGSMLEFPDGRLALVRGLTDNGVFFNPHKQNGVSRKHNAAECEEFQDRIDLFGVADVTTWPVVDVAWVTSQTVQSWGLANGHMSYTRAREVLFVDPNQPRLW